MPTHQPPALLRQSAGAGKNAPGVEVALWKSGAGGKWKVVGKTLFHNDYEALASDWSSVGDDIAGVLTPAVALKLLEQLGQLETGRSEMTESKQDV